MPGRRTRAESADLREAGGRIRIGVGGWVFEPWRESFYPPGLGRARELAHAASRLTSIEINGTYYGAQKPASFARWRDETPEDFVFAVKGPRFATSRRVLAEAGGSIERFFGSGVMELKDKLGPVNWQLLPAKAFDAEDFAAFLTLLPKQVDGLSIRHAVEVRHASFRTPEFVALARAHGVAIVTAGDSPYPQIADVTAAFVYVRLMGSSAAEPGGYAAAALDRWAARARAWAAGQVSEGLETVAGAAADGVARDVFLYVIGGHKPHNPAAATALIERLA